MLTRPLALKRRRSLFPTLFLSLSVAAISACGTTPAAAPTAPAAETPAAAEPTAATAAEAPAGEAAATADASAPTPTPAPVVSGGEGCAPSATPVNWFIGLGSGADAPVIPLEEAWVEKFNKTQTDVCLTIQIVQTTGAADVLRAQIAAGTVPDIVGPVGTVGRAQFKGAWADLTPLAEKAGFDLSTYDKALVDFLKDDNMLVGIPFGVYPSFLYYNKDLFDEARLPYPPHKVGEQYDGKEWNNDTFTELAKKLTVDKNGNDATSADFDAQNITQYGFFQQFTSAQGIGNRFGAGLAYDPASPTTAKIPDSWRKAWTWYYNGIWKDHFMPTTDAQNSEVLGSGNGFASDHIAMAQTHLWYTCCFEVSKLNWDIAVLPSVDGKITSNMHGDTFAIMEQSKNKDAAFKVISKMVVDPEVYKIYNVLPAKVEDRASFFADMDKRVAPNKVDWSVAEEMAKYADVPNHEAWMPNVLKANDAFSRFRALMDQTPDLDINAEIDKLQAELDTLFKEPGAIPATK
ncbi:extracellular solute-binding protein [Chloroflexia bacterium SDU3-3]|nr:extracellular solute-binding protein [Chloroflexia bacterium SDU3-3]